MTKDNKARLRLLQAMVAALSLVPISAGAVGVLFGAAFVGVTEGPASLDSHFRYLSGILLALGLLFLSTVPALDRRTSVFRLAAALVVCGSLGRLLSLLTTGKPSWPHVAALGLELVVVPRRVFWQAQVAQDRWR